MPNLPSNLHIKAENLSFSYRLDFVNPELAALNFEVKKGEYLAILGENGSGKSTLARHFNGLLPLQEGELWVAGVNLRETEKIWQLRRHCAMIFQNPESAFVAATVEEDMAFGLENYQVPWREIPARIDAVLARLGLSHLKYRPPATLSGGQKQFIALAAVLVLEPELLIFDEASSMLDPQSRKELLAIMQKLHAEGKTIIAITHDLEEALAAERVLILKAGRQLASGPSREILRQTELLRSASLKPPLALELWEKLGLSSQNCLPSLTAEELAACFNAWAKSVPVNTSHELAASFACSQGAPKEGSAVKISRQELNKELNQEVSLEADPKEQDAGPWPLERSASARANSLPAGTAFIEVKQLNFSYTSYNFYGEKSYTPALKNLSFRVDAPAIIGLAGSMASGKSSLVKILAALETPQSGQVKICGEDIFAAGYERSQLRKTVGLVLQNPDKQLFANTVAEDVGFSLRHLGLSSEEKTARIAQALADVGLDYEQYKERSPLALSGGEKRRVAIAGVLSANPQILIFDESLAGLDSLAKEEFLKLLQRLKAAGKVILLISHDWQALAEVCERILFLQKSELVFDGSVEEFFLNSPWPTLPTMVQDFAARFLAVRHPLPEELGQRYRHALCRQDLEQALRADLYQMRAGAWAEVSPAPVDPAREGET